MAGTATIHSLTDVEIQAIGKVAIEAKSRAYCPYSKFRVGCGLLLKSSAGAGSIIPGVNVENASYPVGVCAERAAFGTAITAGHGVGSFRAIAVATDLDEACSPCGMCRQFIREFCDNDVPIFMFKNNGGYEVKTIGELLPMSFGPDALARHEGASSGS